MASQNESQATQQATQNALDPRRLGKQNSGFEDDELADIVCLLIPNSENASREVARIASENPYSPHIAGSYAAHAVNADLAQEDTARKFGRTLGMGDHAIVLKLSSAVKSPKLGFTFGRNSQRCDICFEDDPLRRLSNIHFRIYVNNHGVVMLEDQSTNGTIVDDVMLRKKREGLTKRVLNSGTMIKILMHENARDMVFVVRIPLREADLDMTYRGNLRTYFRKLGQVIDPNRTIGPGPSGPVNLFPPPLRNGATEIDETTQQARPEDYELRTPREFRGGEKYNRVKVIGRGAFAIVYQVTNKYTGEPRAAKELDKRKFMKNGVLDQKVENEMKIMQRISHDNIVQYIEHFDWDQHQFIIIMEYVPGGDLGHLVQTRGTITEPYVKIMARQLIDALGYLHDNRITHRDVKPDNILVHSTDPFVVKLTDFGLSKMIDTEQTFLKTFCGTLLYCAPEVYSEYNTYDDQGRRVRQKERRTANKERYDHAVDVWSLGGVLFYALTGDPPFPVKNGTSYTELLHFIMTRPLDVSPLIQRKISATGIRFLERMIDRRPETRASIVELQDHSWLTEPDENDSADEISDDGLEQGASQLSLYDHQRHQQSQSIDMATSELLDPEPDMSMEFEDDKENYTFGQPPANRLWGEVNDSALRSSGAIAEDRLNIPMSANVDEIDDQETEILDSFESDDLSTPRQKRKSQQARGLFTSGDSTTSDNLQNITHGIGSQSLGGTSSYMGQLNMKSVAPTMAGSRSEVSDLNTSKRKPAYDTSDEFEAASSRLKPSFKRLKSKDDGPLEEDDHSLLASIPQIIKSDSGRLIDNPVDKRTFWDAADKNTWHLNYPEMTHTQYNAFKEAAASREEEFIAGQSPLWDVAMHWFPPTKDRSDVAEPLPESRLLLRRDRRSLGDLDDWDLPPTAPVPGSDDGQESVPDTLPPESQIPRPLLIENSSKSTVARLTSSETSVLKGISISVTDPVVSWGRAHDNTMRYSQTLESKIPKHAFRLMLWKEGYTAPSDCFRPWDQDSQPDATSARASPESDNYAYYISTKATNGLRINNNPLPSNESKSTASPSKYWIKLYNGDTVILWGTDDVSKQVRLTFECFWGSSSVLRPLDEPPTCVPQITARRLDSLWPRAEMNLRRDRIKEEAKAELLYRWKHMTREHDRSKRFEVRRAEAARVVALRNSRQASPVSAPAVMGRTIPRFRHGSPLATHTPK